VKYILFALLICLTFSNCQKKEKTSDLQLIIDEYENYQSSRRDARKDQWPVIRNDSLLVWKDQCVLWISALDAIGDGSLSSQDLINRDMLKLILEEQRDQITYESHLMPLNAEGGFLTGIIYRLLNQDLTDDKRSASFVKMMEDLPRYLNQQRSLMTEGISKMKISPNLIVENCIQLLENSISESELATYVDKITDTAAKSKATALLPSCGAALTDFKSFLKNEYLIAAPSAIGIAQTPDGAALYEARVRYFTTYDISPEEVFQTGEREVARIRGEMEAIIQSLDYKGSFADFLTYLRTDPKFYPKTGDELLHYAAWLSKKIEARLPELFGKLPRMPFTVSPVPAAIAENYTGGRYSPGSYEDHRAGAYWVNTTKLNSRPLYVMPALTLHEAVPGHHLQGMLAEELEDLPRFRSNTYLSAFGEGWGLYSEWLGVEAGMYDDPYDNFGRLTYEMWRACRLVVDVGMHYKGWTREQAVEFMASNTALSMHEVNTEINRYIGWPAQAVSYKMGELKIKELRHRAEEKLTDKFDVREFHDVVLENGSVPLKSLERIIDEYIDSKLKG
jgi:uncharacterized protein (DUF885 family)